MTNFLVPKLLDDALGEIVKISFPNSDRRRAAHDELGATSSSPYPREAHNMNSASRNSRFSANCIKSTSFFAMGTPCGGYIASHVGLEAPWLVNLLNSKQDHKSMGGEC